VILKNFSIGKQGSYIFYEDTGIKTVSLFLEAISLTAAVNFTHVSPQQENGVEFLNSLLIMAFQIYLKRTVCFPLVCFGWFFTFEKLECIPAVSLKYKTASCHKILISKCGKVVLQWGCIVLRKGYGAGSLDSFVASRDLCAYIAKYLGRIHGILTDSVCIIILNFLSRETRANSKHEKSW